MAQPHYKATPIRLQTQADFTGGLNIRADAFQLAPNESPDMMNVDVEIGGGFVQRRVVAPYGNGSALVAPAIALIGYPTVSSGNVLAQTDTRVYNWTGSAWSKLTTDRTSATAKCRGAVGKGLLYVQNGIDAPFRWDGATQTALTQGFNNVIGTEGALDGNMPIASLICWHQGRMFIAGTTESATAFPNRIRWSHANFPEDWRAQDFIDIDIGRDSDAITAIVSFRERLYIFKSESILVLTGYGPENFQVVPMMQNVGAVSQEATALSDHGLYFFHWPNGVYLDKGSGPYPIFDKIQPWIRDSLIPAANQSKICLSYVNRKLYCSVPYNGSSANTRTLVYNPWVWKHRYMRFLEGPWVVHDLPISAYLNTFQINGPVTWLAANAASPYVAQLEQTGAQDNWGAGLVNISSFYTTRWEDINQASVFKRWRHPDIIMRGGFTQSVQVDVKKDYDPSVIFKTFWVPGQGGVTNGLVWSDEIGPPTINNVVTAGTPGTTSYSYQITAVNVHGESRPSAPFQINTGNATLNGTNFNTLTWGAVTGATGYKIYGRGNTVGGQFRTQWWLIATLGAVLTYNDQGAVPAFNTPPPLGSTAWTVGGGLWDSSQWFGLPQLSETIKRGASMGTGRAIQMTFTGPGGALWGVDAFTLKYVPKRIRG